ncbi:MAG: enoyl-CoA hydratase [Pseudoxanthomonas sp.]
MSEDILLSSRADGVLTLTLNRPKSRNALSPGLMRALHEALLDAQEDARVRCILLRGEGKDFCAGGDIAAAKDANDARELSEAEKAAAAERAARRGPNTPELLTDWLRRSMESARLLHQMGKPTIAAVHGNVLGAGFGLATACDFRIVADSAKFATGFLKVGYSGDFGGSYFATQLLGSAKARELFLLNESIDADEAQRLGLATRRASDEDLLQVATDFALKLAKGPPIALRYMKQNINAAESAPLEQCFDLEARNQNRSGQTSDSKEAIKALFEKRSPEFQGS